MVIAYCWISGERQIHELDIYIASYLLIVHGQSLILCRTITAYTLVPLHGALMLQAIMPRLDNRVRLPIHSNLLVWQIATQYWQINIYYCIFLLYGHA